MTIRAFETPVDGVYAIRLEAADPADPVRLCGRLEHVLSGRCHDFRSAEELLDCLVRERGRDALAPPQGRGPDSSA